MEERSGVSPSTAVPPESWTELLTQFERFASDSRNIGPAAVKEQKTYLHRFHERFLSPAPAMLLASLSPTAIQHFLFQYATEHGPGSRRWVQFALRTFLRFCYQERYTATDLSAAVPTVRQRRLATVPKAIGDADAERLLDAIDTSVPIGMRDHAILLLLMTYGVRGIHVRQLTLQDIDWRSSRIHFGCTKCGKPVLQHLTAEAGNSLLRYIGAARPDDSDYPHVFLTDRAPQGPFRASGSLSAVIDRRLSKAGIDLPDGVSRGTHSFRHRFAKTMLANGQALKAIADMLGHRDLNSTFLYSKVDVEALHQAALPWPEETTL